MLANNQDKSEEGKDLEKSLHEAKEPKYLKDEKKIFQIINTQGPIGWSKIGKETKFGAGQIQRALNSLLKKFLIKKEEGKYEIIKNDSERVSREVKDEEFNLNKAIQKLKFFNKKDIFLYEKAMILGTSGDSSYDPSLIVKLQKEINSLKKIKKRIINKIYAVRKKRIIEIYNLEIEGISSKKAKLIMSHKKNIIINSILQRCLIIQVNPPRSRWEKEKQNEKNLELMELGDDAYKSCELKKTDTPKLSKNKKEVEKLSKTLNSLPLEDSRELCQFWRKMDKKWNELGANPLSTLYLFL
jgi:hypothetical protein